MQGQPQKIVAVAAQNQIQEIASKIQIFFSKLSWKHGVAISVLALVAFYRWRLVVPVIRHLNSQQQKKLSLYPTEILLTSNRKITFKSIHKISLPKTINEIIWGYKATETIELQNYPGNSSKFALNQSQGKNQITNFDCVFGELLFNSFKIAKLENPHLRMVLIRSEEIILQIFLLKFYGFPIQDIHKMGKFGQNRIQLLMLNQRGTYERTNLQFDENDL